MKKEPLDHEREQDRWLGATLRQTSASPSDRCLDAETLAAWTDGALSADAAAAVETHLSDCAHCIAMVAAMERTAPAAPARHAWAPGRVFRWLVPLTAAATAVALWVAVPDRPVTPVHSPPAEERQAASERADSPREQVPVPGAPPVPAPEGTTSGQRAVPELRAENQSLAREPSTQNPAPSTQKPEPPAELTARDALAKSSPPPPAAEASAPAVPPAAAPAREAAESLAGAAASTSKRGAAFAAVMSLEAVVPANPQFRWRVVGPTSIERSTDGGKTWMKTIPLPRDRVEGLTIVGIRARSDLQAIAQMSNGSEFYTSDGGKVWTPLQEKSAAPF